MSFRPAIAADLAEVADLVQQYYAEESYPFERATTLAALTQLLDDPRLGRVWVADVDGGVVGYLVVTLGYSLEYGGRDAFIDELYILESHRGKGLGRQALMTAERYCVSAGVRALHLEVERHREPAQRLYASAGFEGHGRELLTKLL